MCARGALPLRRVLAVVMLRVLEMIYGSCGLPERWTG